jgi:protocatechuate 3,4-dioxygenase beta subunit
MNKFLKVFNTTLLISAATTAYAEDSVVITSCETTPAIWELKSPPAIIDSNNLRRKTGASEFAQGDFITVEGRVLDSNCIPVVDAVVEIWHANSEGVNQAQADVFHGADPNFAGTGKSITNNLGYYRFLSIFPGASGQDRAPHINFRVKHRDFLPIETEMFFENQVHNGNDKNLNEQVKLAKRQLLITRGEKVNPANSEEGVKYIFNIVLEGKSKYKGY